MNVTDVLEFLRSTALSVEERTALYALSSDLAFDDLQDVGDYITSSCKAKELIKNRLAVQEREFFACLFLDNQNKVISYEELFLGTLNAASIYPREVLKRALQLNAGAVIFAHNHPSGLATPSQADKAITKKLSDLLGEVDIRALDHLLVAGSKVISFSEEGLM